MKNADGMAVCRRVCSSSNRVKVAVLTSYSDPEERRQAYLAGATGYLLKEIDTPKLAQWIRLLRSAPDERTKG